MVFLRNFLHSLYGVKAWGRVVLGAAGCRKSVWGESVRAKKSGA